MVKKSVAQKRSSTKRSSGWNLFVKRHFKQFRKNHPKWTAGQIFQRLSKSYKTKNRSSAQKRTSRRRRSYPARRRSSARRSGRKSSPVRKYKFSNAWQRKVT